MVLVMLVGGNHVEYDGSFVLCFSRLSRSFPMSDFIDVSLHHSRGSRWLAEIDTERGVSVKGYWRQLGSLPLQCQFVPMS